jgi:hypothetical protein
MSWQRAVFFGGAVLVLSACADATAPSTLRQVDGTVFAKRAETTDSTTVDPAGGKNDECSSVVIHVGLDGSLIPICVVIPPPTVLW